jgi:hypothetical protein
LWTANYHVTFGLMLTIDHWEDFGLNPSLALPSTVMSTASKVTLAGTLVSTVGIVVFVHWAQTAEKAASIMFLSRRVCQR